MAPQIAELTDAWYTDRAGQDQPDWTRLRAFIGHLDRHPELAPSAIRARAHPSGSLFFDNLLAAVAEKIADDAGVPRPAWTKRTPHLSEHWVTFGTPRMRAADEAATPEQLRERHIFIPLKSLWRNGA